MIYQVQGRSRAKARFIADIGTGWQLVARRSLPHSRSEEWPSAHFIMVKF